MLLGSVGLILLIACANVANLFLVRAEGSYAVVSFVVSQRTRPGELTNLGR